MFCQLWRYLTLKNRASQSIIPDIFAFIEAIQESAVPDIAGHIANRHKAGILLPTIIPMLCILHLYVILSDLHFKPPQLKYNYQINQ